MNENIHILVVDDEADICEILKFNLELENYSVVTANSVEEILDTDLGKYDLFVLDIMMGQISGLQFAHTLKQNPATASKPIIFITAKDTENDTITGLAVGADDYISKPFSIKEVQLRIQAVLRRTYNSSINKQQRITYKSLIVDVEKKSVSVDAVEIELTKKEYEILQLLISSPSHVYSREEILDEVWPEDVCVLDRTIDVNITRLRKKIAPYGKCIITKLGYGYSFEKNI